MWYHIWVMHMHQMLPFLGVRQFACQGCGGASLWLRDLASCGWCPTSNSGVSLRCCVSLHWFGWNRWLYHVETDCYTIWESRKWQWNMPYGGFIIFIAGKIMDLNGGCSIAIFDYWTVLLETQDPGSHVGSGGPLGSVSWTIIEPEDVPAHHVYQRGPSGKLT